MNLLKNIEKPQVFWVFPILADIVSINRFWMLHDPAPNPFHHKYPRESSASQHHPSAPLCPNAKSSSTTLSLSCAPMPLQLDGLLTHEGELARFSIYVWICIYGIRWNENLDVEIFLVCTYATLGGLNLCPPPPTTTPPTSSPLSLCRARAKKRGRGDDRWLWRSKENKIGLETLSVAVFARVSLVTPASNIPSLLLGPLFQYDCFWRSARLQHTHNWAWEL